MNHLFLNLLFLIADSVDFKVLLQWVFQNVDVNIHCTFRKKEMKITQMIKLTNTCIHENKVHAKSSEFTIKISQVQHNHIRVLIHDQNKYDFCHLNSTYMVHVLSLNPGTA